MENRTLIFDESGNLGNSGRYFVIACIDTNDPKSLHNVMKKAVLKARQTFPELIQHKRELKANEVYPFVKHYILEKIVSKNVRIAYIVADLHHTDEALLKNRNLFYNFLMKLLIDTIISKNYKNKKLSLICDNKTIKVQSKNSFSDYIKIHLNYERNLNLDITVEYRDSNAKNSYIVQAADYVANAIYSYYEHGTSVELKDIIDKKCNNFAKFPISKFGK